MILFYLFYFININGSKLHHRMQSMILQFALRHSNNNLLFLDNKLSIGSLMHFDVHTVIIINPSLLFMSILESNFICGFNIKRVQS